MRSKRVVSLYKLTDIDIVGGYLCLCLCNVARSVAVSLYCTMLCDVYQVVYRYCMPCTREFIPSCAHCARKVIPTWAQCTRKLIPFCAQCARKFIPFARHVSESLCHLAALYQEVYTDLRAVYQKIDTILRALCQKVCTICAPRIRKFVPSCDLVPGSLYKPAHMVSKSLPFFRHPL
jgi:hypothetical protein